MLRVGIVRARDVTASSCIESIVTSPFVCACQVFKDADDDEFADKIDRLHEVSDRVRDEYRTEKKAKRSLRVEELFVAIDVSAEGCVSIDDLNTLASTCNATGRESLTVWTEDKLKSSIRKLESEAYHDEVRGDAVDQKTFVEYFERVLPSDSTA